MSNKKETQFKENNKSAVGHGSGKISISSRKIRRLNKDQFIKEFDQVYNMNYDEFKKMTKNLDAYKLTTGQVVIIRTIEKAIAKGESFRLETIFDRIFGKAKQEIDHTFNLHDSIMTGLEKWQNEK
jgi:predicted ABC-type ATPase